jgi:hypothetical protein
MDVCVTRRDALPGDAEVAGLGESSFERVNEAVVLVRVEMTVSIEDDRDGGVSSDDCDLLRVRSLGDLERDSGMAKIVDTQRCQSASIDCGEPEAAAEKASSDGNAVGGLEDELIVGAVFGLDELEFVADGAGNRNRSNGGTGLGVDRRSGDR